MKRLVACIVLAAIGGCAGPASDPPVASPARPPEARGLAENGGASAMLNVRDFGAKGDGVADDTAAIQRALDAAARNQDTVFVPAGTYLCSTLKVHPQTGLRGHPTFSYRSPGGAVLKLKEANVRCLLDITGAIGVTIEGLCLDGSRGLGQGIHGILLDKPNYGKQEDALRIERCRIANFSGHGVLLSRVWCFSIRHSMIAFNKGNGIRLRGWDGFILDNWLSGNGSAGLGVYDESSAVTITANRIEWNATGGIDIRSGYYYNITGNYIDRSGGPGIKIVPGATWDEPKWRTHGGTTITGNMIYRSGCPRWGPLTEADDSHIRLEEAEGVTCVGNTMVSGRNDDGKGPLSPKYGIVCRKLRDSVVKDNTMWRGATGALMLDEGGHADNVVIRDNVGSLADPPKP